VPARARHAAPHHLAEVRAGRVCDQLDDLGLAVGDPLAHVVVEERQRFGCVVQLEVQRFFDEAHARLGQVGDLGRGRFELGRFGHRRGRMAKDTLEPK
jgi:hypothetical protein